LCEAPGESWNFRPEAAFFGFVNDHLEFNSWFPPGETLRIMHYGALPQKEQSKQAFRVCDYCAYLISEEMPEAPRCELYWDVTERDKAVKECAEFLRKRQYELHWKPKSLKLDKPATAAQVEKGEAVFSQAGKGEVRMVKGLILPVAGRWTTLKDQPYQVESTDPQTGEPNIEIKYRQQGQIIQAEEVLKDGKWQRYYGFVGAHHIARVPAEEIDLSLELDWWDRGVWAAIGDGFHARLDLPPATGERFEGFPPRLLAGAALPFSVIVRNAGRNDQTSPTPQRSLRLRLFYSPEAVSPKGELVPRAVNDTDWKELPLKREAKFQPEKGKTLVPTEKMKLPTIELREWFDVKNPGFYRLQLLPAGKSSGSADTTCSEILFSLAPPESK
jgi:hypothetical protein